MKPQDFWRYKTDCHVFILKLSYMSIIIDPIQLGSPDLQIVASRMRDTLIDVLGEEVGESMYSLEWLYDRAVSHIDGRLLGAIYIARVGPESQNVGHIIVRQEEDERGQFGLVTTAYVLPEMRRKGIASTLLGAAHTWFLSHRLFRTATDTAENNHPLIALYGRHGYEVIFHSKEKQMVRLSRELLSTK